MVSEFVSVITILDKNLTRDLKWIKKYKIPLTDFADNYSETLYFEIKLMPRWLRDISYLQHKFTSQKTQFSSSAKNFEFHISVLKCVGTRFDEFQTSRFLIQSTVC